MSFRISWWRGVLTWVACALVLTTVSTVLRVRSDVQDNGLRRKPAGQAIGAVVTFVSDVDRDGHGLLSRPGDPAPFDARVYPYALDIPGNGIDEDGIGGDLPVDPSVVAPVAVAAPFAQTPPVILVMLETFRADLLGQTEGGRAVTPVLNQLAVEGAATTRAYSHNGYTVQSRFHLFTGGLAGRAQDTLLDDFRRHGYDTAYFSAQDESFGGRAFDIGAARADLFYDARQDRGRRFTTFTTAGSLGVSSSVVLERVGAYLKGRAADRPLFLFVNFYDTHFPYWHDQMESLVSDARVPQRDIVASNAADVRRMYRNAAANVDKAVGALREAVRAHVGREPAIVVLADHGESLFDDGFLGHGFVLNDLQTRIPLVAAGLALDLCEPVGQADLRGAIVAALARPADGGRPSFRACPGRTVFQYLGTLQRPRQIAFTGASGRLIYDVREHRVQVERRRVGRRRGARRDARVPSGSRWSGTGSASGWPACLAKKRRRRRDEDCGPSGARDARDSPSPARRHGVRPRQDRQRAGWRRGRERHLQHDDGEPGDEGVAGAGGPRRRAHATGRQRSDVDLAVVQGVPP